MIGGQVGGRHLWESQAGQTKHSTGPSRCSGHISNGSATDLLPQSRSSMGSNNRRGKVLLILCKGKELEVSRKTRVQDAEGPGVSGGKEVAPWQMVGKT